MRDDEPTLREFPTAERVRCLFIPADHRVDPVMGWRTEKGFEPDAPLNSHDGFLVRVRSKT